MADDNIVVRDIVTGTGLVFVAVSVGVSASFVVASVDVSIAVGYR